MASDQDVFICYGSDGEKLAATIADGLRRRGFRVLAHGPVPPGPVDPARLALIESTPDFLAILPPTSLHSLALEEDGVAAEVRQAVRTRRNIVQVRLPADPSDDAERALEQLFSLRGSQSVTYDASRPAESLAIIAHRLSSDTTVDERRVLRRSTRLFWFAGAILLAGIALQEVPRLLEQWSRPRLLAPIPPFALSWAGVGQRLEGGRWVEFPLAPETPVSSGDRLSLVFSPSANGFAYVVSRSANDEVLVLFPTDTARGASAVSAGKLYVAPVDTGWLTVDEQAAGGSIYLIAGYDPLHNLEELIDEPATAPAVRRQLLEATVGGLLDGKHGATERRVWTGKLHPVDRDLKWASGPAAAAVTLADGRSLTRTFAVQPGLISTSVEIKLVPR